MAKESEYVLHIRGELKFSFALKYTECFNIHELASFARPIICSQNLIYFNPNKPSYNVCRI